MNRRIESPIRSQVQLIRESIEAEDDRHQLLLMLEARDAEIAALRAYAAYVQDWIMNSASVHVPSSFAEWQREHEPPTPGAAS